jgi:hypothetical protein
LCNALDILPVSIYRLALFWLHEGISSGCASVDFRAF